MRDAPANRSGTGANPIARKRAAEDGRLGGRPSDAIVLNVLYWTTNDGRYMSAGRPASRGHHRKRSRAISKENATDRPQWVKLKDRHPGQTQNNAPNPHRRSGTAPSDESAQSGPSQGSGSGSTPQDEDK